MPRHIRGSRRAISPHSGDGEFIDINDISASTKSSDHGATPQQTTNNAGPHQNTNDTHDIAIRMPGPEATRDDLRSVGIVFFPLCFCSWFITCRPWDRHSFKLLILRSSYVIHVHNCNSSRCNWNRPNRPKVVLPAVQVKQLLLHQMRLQAALVSMPASLGWWMRWSFPALFSSNLDPRMCFLMILIVGNQKNQHVWAWLQSCTRSFPVICMKWCRSTPVFVILYVLDIRILLILIHPKFVKKLDNQRREIIHQFRTETAAKIFSHNHCFYSIDYDRSTIPEFTAELIFPSEKGFSKYAPILFPQRKRDMRVFLKCSHLVLASFKSIF